MYFQNTGVSEICSKIPAIWQPYRCEQVGQHQRIFRDYVLVQKRKVLRLHTFVAQTVTISVATAGDFSLDLGFSCFI